MIIHADCILAMSEMEPSSIDAIICPVCGKEYKPNPMRLKWGRGTTCSRDCSYKLRAFGLSKSVQLTCKKCGGSFKRPPSHIGEKGRGQYCSPSCAYSSKKRGEGAANWQGGKLSEQEAVRKSPEYKAWVRGVFARDDYTCQECGERGGRLHAHHVLPFADFPEYRIEPGNGVTLCQDCHLQHHQSARDGRPTERNKECSKCLMNA